MESRAYTLALAGDVRLGRLVDRTIAAADHAYPWGNMLCRLRQTDLFLVDLECALTTHAQPWPGGSAEAVSFRADPQVVETLRLAGVDGVSLANNHSLDFGPLGLAETLQVLKRAGIAYAGAGRNLAEARRVAKLQVDGFRVAVVAFADHPGAWAATPEAPGINHVAVSLEPADFDTVEESLAEARRLADFVVFSIHWGPRLRTRPTTEFRAFARRVIAGGADVFWGHSAHVVQGIETVRGKVILYDTGGFVDDDAVDPGLRNDLSALFVLKLRPPGIEGLELLPVKIDRCQVNRAEGADRDWFIRRVAALCAELGTTVREQPDGLVVALSPTVL